MPIISMLTRALFLGCLLANAGFADASGDDTIAVSGPNNVVVQLSISGHMVSASVNDGMTTNRVLLDKPSTLLLHAADEVIPLNKTMIQADSAQVFLLMLRMPSQHSNPRAFCGAGHEDYLVLMKYAPSGLALLDKLLIQSCLKSIELASDSGDDPGKSVVLESNQAAVRLAWLAHPDYAGQDKEVVIHALRLVVK